MTSFADISLSELKIDCRYYTGYRPCHKHDGCPDCPHYRQRGEQLLVIKLGAMGDVLRCKAILPALKNEHPDSWIVWLTEAGSEGLANDPLVDEVRAFTPEGLAALEGRHFVRLICLDKDPHAVALSAKLDAKKRQGFAPTPYNTITVWNEAAMYALRLGLSDELKFKLNRKTMPQIVAEMAELPYRGEEYGLIVPYEDRSLADHRWRRMMIPRGKRVIGLNTGCGPVFATKAWTHEGFSDFLRLVQAQDDLAVVLLGGPREKGIHDLLTSQFRSMLGKQLFDSGTDNPLELFFALVERCDVVVTADSLAMHVAVALKRPVVAWFGPTCEQEVDLFGRGEKIVTDFTCSPCYLKECPMEVTCMQAMRAEDVFAATKRVLEDNGYGA